MTDDLGKDPAVYNSGVQAPPDVPGMKLGKLQAKYLKGVPPLGAYTAQLPPPPLTCDYTGDLQNIGMMGNDQISDCGPAMVGHTVEVWTSQVATEVVLPDSTIIAFYSAESGYVPGDPNTDNGIVLSDMLLYWYKNPIDNHALSGFASIRPGNRTSIRDAIYLFGAVAIGIQLPIGVQNGGDWLLPVGQTPTGDWAPGSWGGHAIPACAYDAAGVTVISWGRLLRASWDFLDTYMDEAYGLLSKDWMTSMNSSPPGFNWAALEQDMSSLRVSP